jgi:hypothetical protein
MAIPTPAYYNAAISPIVGGRFRYTPPVFETIPLNEVVFSQWPPSTICSIPVVEGFSAYVHPKVIDTGISGWNGHRYWMCNTNYPGTNDEVENPSVFVSEDGTNWMNAGNNPVVPKPNDWQNGRVYNSDPHIVIGHDNVMYMYWRFYHLNEPPRERLMCVYSSDGVTWSEQAQVLTLHESWDSGLLSPVVEYHNGTYCLWSFRSRTDPTTCTLRTATNPLGPWSSPQTCTLALPPEAGSREIWHFDVIRIDNGWAMLLSDRNVDPARLWFAYGDDSGLVWEVKGQPMNNTLPVQYRPSIVRTESGFDCWLTNWTANPRRLERVSIRRQT